MTHIRNVFNAGYAELHGLNADPNTVIKIQGLVKEMLETNEHRQRRIYQELTEEYQAFALPGVISATYLFIDQLGNSRTRDMLAGLMVTLCANNTAAQRLLLRSGIVDNPFEESRQVAFAAYQALPTLLLTDEDSAWLLKKARQFATTDRHSAVLLYELLLKQSRGYKEALDDCRAWFAGPYETSAPSALMNALLRYYPQEIEATLTRLFEAIEEKDTEAGKNIKREVRLPDLTALKPAIAAAAARLKQQETRNSRGSKVKAVEFFFEGAVADQIAQNADQIATWSDIVEQYKLELLSRYWWQALSTAVKTPTSGQSELKSYIEQALPRANDDFALWGYIQLMFLANPHHDKKSGGVKAWATQLLADLLVSNPDVYQQATKQYEGLNSGNVGGDGPKQGPGRQVGIKSSST